MGTPIPLPGEVGGSCPHGDVILWPAGQTPKYMKADFIDVENCGLAEMPFVNGTYVLEQQDDSFCDWFFETDNLLISISVGEEYTIILAMDKVAYLFFYSYALNGTLHFLNVFIECGGGDDAIGGTCDLDFT